MIKLMDKITSIKAERTGGELKPGCTFLGNVAAKPTSLYLKTYSGIVDLQDPNSTWDNSDTKIENFQEVDVEIKILKR